MAPSVQLMNSGPAQRPSVPPDADQILDLLLRYHRWDRNSDPQHAVQLWQGSCDWILQHPKYTKWRDQKATGIFVIAGPPRCGKSVLLSFIFGHLEPQAHKETRLYYSFEDTFPKPASEIKALRSFLWQILSRKPNLVHHALPMFRDFGSSIFLSTDLLWDIFLALIRDKETGHVCCFVDGLDYCEADVRSKVLSKLIAETTAAVRVRVDPSRSFKAIVTTLTDQRLADAVNMIPGSQYISLLDRWEIARRRNALQVAIPFTLRIALKAQGKIKISSRDKDKIESYIIENTEDDILWASLVFKSALSILDSNPQNRGASKLLTDTVLQLPKRSTELAIHLLSGAPWPQLNKFKVAILWLIFTSGTLAPSDLLTAVNQYLQRSHLGKAESDAFFECLQTHPLIDFTPSRVRLVHPSLYQGLLEHLRSSSSLFGGRTLEKTISRTCLSYLVSEEFNEPVNGLTMTDQSEIDFFLTNHTFYSYAATNWHIHLHSFGSDLDDLWSSIERLCQQAHPCSRLWLFVYLSSLPITGISPPALLPTIHVAAILGFSPLIQRLISLASTNHDPFIMPLLVNSLDLKGKTALHWAAELGSPVVGSLISYGIDLSVIDGSGQLALERACWKGNGTTVKAFLRKMNGQDITRTVAVASGKLKNARKIEFLLEYAASERLIIPVRTRSVHRNPLSRECMLIIAPRLSLLQQLNSTQEPLFPLVIPMTIESLASTTADGRTPLHIAADIGNLAMVNWLLSASAPTDRRCGQGKTATHIAVERNNLEILEALGRRLDMQDNSGQTALHKAVRWPQGVRYLLKQGARPNIPDQDGNTPLHAAIAANSIECFSLLVAQSRLQVRNRDGLTAADLAFLLKRTEMLNTLIDMAVLPTKLNQNGQSLLHQACEDDDNALVILLLNKGAGMNETDSLGRMPLEILAWKQNIPLIKEMIQRGCDWEGVLLKAASGGQHPIVALLLTYARGDLQDVLHEAWNRSVRDDHFRVGKVLLTAGLYVEHRDRQGATPLWKAVGSGAMKSIEILLAQHPSLDGRYDGMTSLHKAVTNNALAVMESLLEAGASPNLRDEKWQATPLFIAIQVGSVRAVRLLLRYGADKELRTNNKTALESAIDRKSASIVQLLLEKGASTCKCREWLNDAIDSNDSSLTQVLLPYTSLTGVEINRFVLAAAKNQYMAVVKALLKRVDVEARGLQYGHKALVWAAINGHVAVTEALLENGADVNATNTDELTALQLAAEIGHEAVVQLLIQYGADVEAHPHTTSDNSSDDLVISSRADKNGKRALHLAAENRHETVVLLLVEGGADIDAGDYSGRTAVHLATENGHEKVVLLLTRKGANAKAEDSSGKTALHLASENGHISLVRSLLWAGVNIDAADSDGDTALHLAALNGHEAVVRELVVKEAHIDVQNKARVTALHTAVDTSRLGIVKILLDAGANPKDESSRNESVLHIAIQNNALEIVRLLLQYGANAETLVEDKTPLEVAVSYRSSSIVQLLLDSGVSTSKCRALLGDAIGNNDIPTSYILLRFLNLRDPEVETLYWKTNPFGREEVFQLLLQRSVDFTAKDYSGLTTLHWAARRGYQSVARILLEKGADINEAGSDGCTPLHRAIEHGHETLALMLLERKANIEAIASPGYTALHVAAKRGNKAVVGMLLEMGADIMSRTDDRRTPLHCAAREGHESVVRLLLEKGAKVAAISNGGRTALHCASLTGHESVVRLLLENSAATTATTKYENETALHWAAENGHEAVVRLLLERDACIDAMNSHAYTPLCKAAKAGHEAIVRLLLEMGSEINETFYNGYRHTTTARMALIAADDGGHEAVMRLLIERGLDVSMMEGGYTVLHRAARHGFHSLVELVLLEKDSEINKKSKHGMTALMLAAWEGHHKTAKILLDRGAQINVEEDVDGETALHGAARNGHGEVVQLLLEKGADAEAEDRLGRTAFALAMQGGVSTATLVLQSWALFPAEMRRYRGGWYGRSITN